MAIFENFNDSDSTKNGKTKETACIGLVYIMLHLPLAMHYLYVIIIKEQG